MIYYILPILAVIIGALFVLIFRPKENKKLKLLLAFSGAFLLGITLFELLPSLFVNHSNGKSIGLFIVIGILIQICLEYFSKGAEHGHVHINKKNNLFPWLLFISLSIHSLIEGTPLHNNHHNILLGIVIHKIPVAIILTTFFISSSIPKHKIFLFISLFSLMTPLGTYLVETIPHINTYSNYISAISVGIFLHISTTILFESSEGHKFNLVKLLIISFGLLTSYLI